MKSRGIKWTFLSFLLVGIFFPLLACDIILKAYTSGFLDHPVTVLSLPFGIEFSLEKVLNQGAMWGVFSQYSQALFLFRICVVIVLVVILFAFTRKKSTAFFLTLVTTGAIGNVADTLAYGHVIDMLHFTFSGHSYGIFNLADVYIFIGCLGLIILSFLHREN